MTMEKGTRLLRIYAPSGALEQELANDLSFAEHDYYLYREKRVIHLYDAARRSHWEVRHDFDA